MDKWREEIKKAFKSPDTDSGYITIPVIIPNFTLESKKYNLVKRAIERGSIETRINKIRKSNQELLCYELMYRVEEGDHGDEEGYGVEPDVWIIAFVDLEGNFITPFCLEDEPQYKEYLAELKKNKFK